MMVFSAAQASSVHVLVQSDGRELDVTVGHSAVEVAVGEGVVAGQGAFTVE